MAKENKGLENDVLDTLYDPVRECWVANTPEERVRQSVTYHLTQQLGYPLAKLSHEWIIRIGNVVRRCDTVVFDPYLQPLMVVEYKAPYVQLTDKVLTQVFNYNSVLQVPVVMITNGSSVAVYKVGYGGRSTQPLHSIPSYQELLHLAEKPY